MGLRLFFLPNFRGATFIPDSRVAIAGLQEWLKTKNCLHHTFNNYMLLKKLFKRFGIKHLPKASYELRFATFTIEG